MQVLSPSNLKINRNSSLSKGLVAAYPIVVGHSTSNASNKHTWKDISGISQSMESQVSISSGIVFSSTRRGLSFDNDLSLGFFAAGLGIIGSNTATCPVKPTKFSVSCWCRLVSFANSYNYVFSCEGLGQNGYTLLIKSSGKLAFYLNTTAGDRNYDGTGAFTLVANKDYLFTVTYDGRFLTVWVNGQIDKQIDFTTNGDSIYGTQQLVFGNGGFPTRALNSTFDNIGIWNRALTQNETQRLYVNPRELYVSEETIEQFGSVQSTVSSQSNMFLTF